MDITEQTQVEFEQLVLLFEPIQPLASTLSRLLETQPRSPNFQQELQQGLTQYAQMEQNLMKAAFRFQDPIVSNLAKSGAELIQRHLEWIEAYDSDESEKNQRESAFFKHNANFKGDLGALTLSIEAIKNPTMENKIAAKMAQSLAKMRV